MRNQCKLTATSLLLQLYYTLSGSNPELAGREEAFPTPDNPSKMKRSCENAEHVGKNSHPEFCWLCRFS